MAALARLAQLEHRAPRHDFATVRDERLEHRLEVEHLRLAVHQGDHVHAEAVLQLGQLVQVVEHDLRDLPALELDHHAHARLVGFVPDIGNAFYPLVDHELRDLFEESLLVDLIRKLVDDDRLAVASADVFEVRTGTHDDPAAAGAVTLVHSRNAVNDARGRKVRRRHELDQFLDRALRLMQNVQAGVDHFAEVVRRNIGRHADRDARGSVDQQVRDARRQDQRLFLRPVVIGAEIHRLLVDIGQQLVADPRHADLGVAHGRGVVAVDRAEVALAVDQHVAQREILCHAHDGVVDRGIAVRMVLTDDVSDDARRLLVGAIPVVRKLVHRVQNAPMHRLETIAHVGQRAPDDYAHRVVEVRPPHLLFEADRERFFCELVHARLGCCGVSAIARSAPASQDG